MIRRMLFLIMLSAAIGGTMLAFDPAIKKQLTDSWNQVASSRPNATERSTPLAATSTTDELLATPSHTINPTLADRGPTGVQLPPLEGAPIYDLREVFRFDVSPQWVTSRWARISTVLANTELKGMRTPLVTGTAPDDVAGSLTYYFDQRHQLQRITFHGFTADERRLVALLVNEYECKPLATLDRGLYVSKRSGKPMSGLRITHAPVVRASAPHSQMKIDLEINRKGSKLRMSDQFRAQLRLDERARR